MPHIEGEPISPENINEQLRNYISDFLDDFLTSDNKESEVHYRRTEISVKDGRKLKKLPVVITTSAKKEENGTLKELFIQCKYR